jgi:hypothetical protein
MSPNIPKVSKTLSIPLDLVQRVSEISIETGKDFSKTITELVSLGIKDRDSLIKRTYPGPSTPRNDGG